MTTRSDGTLPNRRRLTLTESAQKKRGHQCTLDECFDPVRYIEHTLPKIVKGFEFDYSDEHEVFVRAPEVQAFANFKDNPILVIRSNVMERAYYGDGSARFILCHEIGHIFLHKRKATQLARHTLGSAEQYRTSRTLEMEANLFGGVLLVPPEALWPGISPSQVCQLFNCSMSVAEYAIRDAKFWFRANGRRWDA